MEWKRVGTTAVTETVAGSLLNPAIAAAVNTFGNVTNQLLDWN